jgi:hypothetical protein
MDALPNMTAASARQARSKSGRRTAQERKVHGRARVSNGNALLGPGIADERSVWCRRLRDLIAEHVADLGGIDNTSAAERSLIRRVATLTVELERLEAKFAAAGEAAATDLDLYQRSTGNLRRLLQTLGLQKRARDVTPSLSAIMREHVELTLPPHPRASDEHQDNLAQISARLPASDADA